MKFYECFAGIGGFRSGLEAYNFECIGYNEIDKYASKLYSHYYNDNRNDGDITKLNPHNLPNFDLLVGGFPCQPFSVTGLRKGLNDSRGNLFLELVKILKVKKPKYFIFENVKGLLSNDKGSTFEYIITTISEAGYDCEWHIINSIYYGVPQFRERVFIIGYLRKTRSTEILPFKKDNKEIKQTQKKSFYTITARHGGSGKGDFIAKGAKLVGARKLTPKECLRLQGFNDSLYDKAQELNISDTQLYKMAGNAVTVNVIKYIAKYFKRIENDNR